MGAVAAISAALIGAGTAIYSAEKSSEQNDKMRKLAEQQSQKQDQQMSAALYEQESVQKLQELEMAKQQKEAQSRELADKNRDFDLSKKKANKGQGGRESTILTGPQGLNYETQQKTLIGG